MLSEQTRDWLQANDFDPQRPNHPGRHSDSPLILASRRGEGRIVDELLAHGVEVNHRNMDGTNALWAACVADDFNIAARLLEHGAELDNQNDNGATVLMYAASNGRAAWVRYLLEAGADPALRSLDDYSALDLASTREILRILRQSPA